MQAKDYIGVTGVSNVEEVLKVRDIVEGFIENQFLPQDKQVMLGYLVSNKTFNGIPTENLRYPFFKDLPDMLNAAGNDIFTAIHYNSRDTNLLSDQIIKIFDYEDIYENNLCRAFQLNMAWPDVKAIDEIKSSYPDICFILSLTDDAISGNTPGSIADKTEEYQGLADYVLIDPSGGAGKPFDIEQSVQIYHGLKANQITDHIGFAGGFNPDNVGAILEDLMPHIGTKDISIDIEKGARIPLSPRYGDDEFSEVLIMAYLGNSINTYNQFKPVS